MFTALLGVSLQVVALVTAPANVGGARCVRHLKLDNGEIRGNDEVVFRLLVQVELQLNVESTVTARWQIQSYFVHETIGGRRDGINVDSVPQVDVEALNAVGARDHPPVALGVVRVS